MRSLSFYLAICAFLPAGASGATIPVGFSTGQADFYPVGPVQGASVDVGVEGAIGTWTMAGGQKFGLTAGPTETPQSQPALGFGHGGGANGDVLLTGAGTELRLTGQNTGATAQIGHSGGTGSLTISNGASFVAQDFANQGDSSVSIQLGLRGGVGTLTFDNGTGLLEDTVDANLFLGTRQQSDPLPGGSGTINVLNGSSVVLRGLDLGLPVNAATAGIVLGHEASTSSSMNINASSVLLDSQSSSAGISVATEKNSSGVFSMTGGATVDILANSLGTEPQDDKYSYINIGMKDGSNGRLEISDGSVLTMSGPQGYIGIGRGEGSIGRMTISNGGEFHYTGASGYASIGQDETDGLNGGVGLLTVSGVGSVFDFNGTVDVAKFAGTGSSTGIVRVEDGGLLTTRDLNLHEGALLQGGGGTVDGNVNLNGGVVAPGASPGQMTIEGDLSVFSGLLEIEIGGTDSTLFDRLFVTGDLIIGSALDVEVSFLDGFLPSFGDVFDFLIIGGTVESDLSSLFNFSFSGVPPSSFSVSETDGVFALTNIVVAPSTIPLPPSAVMLLAGVAGIVGLRSLRKGHTPSLGTSDQGVRLRRGGGLIALAGMRRVSGGRFRWFRAAFAA